MNSFDWDDFYRFRDTQIATSYFINKIRNIMETTTTVVKQKRKKK